MPDNTSTTQYFYNERWSEFYTRLTNQTVSGIWEAPSHGDRYENVNPETGENMQTIACTTCRGPTSGNFSNDGEPLCGDCLKRFCIDVFNLFREHNENYREFYKEHPEIDSVVLQIPMETFKKFRDIRL